VKIHKGDTVIVMTGKDRTLTGKVLVVDPGRNRVLVEGVNRVTRHEKIRPTQRGGQTGGISEKESWVHASNVQLISPEDGKPTRAKYVRIDPDSPMSASNKKRVCARTGVDL
jgi:large subunit ribosomal protein L24